MQTIKIKPVLPASVLYSLTANGYAITDSTGQKVGSVFYAPESGIITGAGIRVGTVRASDSIQVRLEGESSGVPNGSLVETSPDSTFSIASPSSNTWYNGTFSGSHSVTKGDLLSLVIRGNGSTGDLDIIAVTASQDSARFCFPNPSFCYDPDGLGYDQTNNRSLSAAINYNGSYYPILNMFPGSGTDLIEQISTTTNNKHIAVKFRLREKVRAWGAWHYDPKTNRAARYYLWEGGTVLASSANAPATIKPWGIGLAIPFTNSYILSPNVWYRLSCTPTNSDQVRTYYTQQNSTALMGAFGMGTDLIYSESNTNPPTQESHWNDTNNYYPTSFGLLIDQIDDGGSIYFPRPNSLLRR